MRVVFAAARSAPGVTTAMLACASVWPGRTLLVEASEDGGALAARFGLGLEPGLTTLAAAVRHSAEGQALAGHRQPLPGTDGRITALVAPAALEPAQALLHTFARRLAELLAEVDEQTTVLVDAGRLPATPLAAPLIETADRFVLVARPRVEELQTLSQRLPMLAELGCDPELVLVGQHPYGPEEVATALGCPVTGVLAHDPRAADGLAASGPPRRLARSLLVRSARGVVDRLLDDRPATALPAPTDSRDPGAGKPRLFTASRP